MSLGGWIWEGVKNEASEIIPLDKRADHRDSEHNQCWD